jgi:glycosyltransferase involved in cell wall biosynthesis
MEINCMLVSGLDPLTRHLRTGAALRYNNPPRNVNYNLHMDHLGYPEYLGHYGLGLVSVPLSAARLFTEALFPLEKRNCSLIHSLFWSIHKYPLPWIHENDQSLGQYLSEYVKFEGYLMRKIAGISADMLNAEKCRAVVVWSKWARQGYVQDGVDGSKIRVIPPAFTTTPNKIRHDTTNILFLGRDYHRKGGDVALMVFENLKKSFDNLHMIFVGRIPEKETLVKVKEDRSISYFEYVSKSELHEKIFQTSDIFLLPTEAEAYGMSIVEALSYGIPVVSSNISAIPEVVEDGVSGYLAAPRSVDYFTRKCAELLDDREKRERMGGKAMEKVQRDFSPEKIGSELYDLYLDCLS